VSRRMKCLAVSLAVACWSPALYAQGLEIAPIGIEIADGENDLVRVALATGNTAPLIEILPDALSRPASRAPSGLPSPSVILGFVAPGQETDFGIASLLPETVAARAFDLDDLVARAALRDTDPEMFRRLIEEGHMDPPAERLPWVLQGELARMKCNTTGVDGIWGRGSRRSVGAYFAQLDGVDWPDQAPTAELFRALMLNGDVTCPPPTPVAVRQPPAGGSNNVARTPVKPPAPVQPTPPKSTPKLTLGSGLGIGVLN